jgi:hypothetical protein
VGQYRDVDTKQLSRAAVLNSSKKQQEGQRMTVAPQRNTRVAYDYLSFDFSLDFASLLPLEHSAGAGTQAPFESHCLRTKISMQFSSPGGQSLHD